MCALADPIERLVNLAMYLAAAREPVPGERIRTEVLGYGSDQDEAAFLRMFERDKEDLRSAGLAIVSDARGRYRLDAAATYATELELAPPEAATVRAAAAALIGDSSFPFADDLRLALAKIGTADDPEAPTMARIADESPAEQGALAARLAGAVTARKRVDFSYTNSLGRTAPHQVEPYGMFVRDGRWYLVGRDTARNEVRTYTVSRMREVQVDRARPKQPDFERPADFDVSTFIRLPFHFGPADLEVVLRFEPDTAWRVPSLTCGHGTTTTDADGSVLWTTVVRNPRRLACWTIEHGPGIHIVSPPDLAESLHTMLLTVASLHA